MESTSLGEPIEIKVARMEEKLVGLKERGDETNLMVRNLDSKVSALNSNLELKIDKLPKEFSKQYASKLSEKIVYGMVTLILIAFLSGVIYLVIPRR